MGKKVKEFKAGDFIFAKVKGYPAWPARVQGINGKKYFVYFYGTGEIANLPPNMIFDYAENKDKFLTKTVKRKDFNDGVKQIDYDFTNNVPLEEVLGTVSEQENQPSTSMNETSDDTANDTVDESMADTTGVDDTMNTEDGNATKNETAIEDSDEGAPLVIDEAKQKGRKSKVEPAKTPAKEKEPVKPAASRTARNQKTPAKKEDEEESQRKEEDIVSRSGRKIKPKRYIDERPEESTVPSPAPAAKKRRGASPDKAKTGESSSLVTNNKHYNAVRQSEIEDLKEPFNSVDTEKENILIAYMPGGQYIGVKLFQSRPTSFKSDAARLQWDKQAAKNAIKMKLELERGHITPQSVSTQLETDLNLTDADKANLSKERDVEEKKSRVHFLKTEMKLIDLDAKIKTCLSLEKADTDQCLKLLDNLMELEVKPLMLLKHPTCLETVKRMRCYVGNTPSWDLSEDEALVFSKKAHFIRKKADQAYEKFKDLFTTLEGLSFWEYFSERVLQFKKCTSNINNNELLEMVHEPLQMTSPTSHTMRTAIDNANKEGNDDTEPKKKKATPNKSKKTPNSGSTPSKPPLKRQTSKKTDEKTKKSTETEESAEKGPDETANEDGEKETEDVANTDGAMEVDKTTNETEIEKETPQEEATNNAEDEPKPESLENTNSKVDQKTADDEEKDKEEQKVEEVTNNKEARKEKTQPETNKNVADDKVIEAKEDQVVEAKPKRGREVRKAEPSSVPKSPGKRKSKQT